MTRNVVKQLFKREQNGDKRFARCYWQRRTSKLEFSQHKTVQSAHAGGITWFDLDQVEHRYLLAGASDGSIAAYDMLLPSSRDTLSGTAEHGAAFAIDRRHAAGHKFTVSTVAWYPVDTGLFVSGSFDRSVKVWDTNAQQPVVQLQLTDKVYALALSPIATRHCLVAVGSGEPAVRLADPSSGGFTHVLSGHRDAVWAVAWSRGCEYQLVSGSVDGQVRLWDIRRSGVLHVFDAQQTSAAARPRSAARNGGGARRSAAQPNLRSSTHNGFVTAVYPTPDGLYWLTAGTDSRVRLWDTQHARHQLVNYSGTHNSAMKARQICCSDDRQFLFHPSGSVVQVFALMGGQLHTLLRGAHFETINAVAWNPLLQELYTGANDNNIIVWSPREPEPGATVGEHDGMVDDQDNWSD